MLIQTKLLVEDTELEVTQLWNSLSKYGIIEFYRKGKIIEYNGGRKEDDIVSWVVKRTGPPSNKVECEELEKKVEENKFSVAFFGDANSRDYSEVYL